MARVLLLPLLLGCAAAMVPRPRHSRRRATPPKPKTHFFDAGASVTVSIHGLSSDGAGVGRVVSPKTGTEVVLFVPFTVDGDVVTATIATQGKRSATAVVTTVIERSPDRAAPSCAHFGDCGGCQYQHVTLDHQRTWKRRHVADALRRVGGFPNATVAATVGGPSGYGYRSKLTPHAENGRVGFRAVDGVSLVDIERCALADDAVNAGLAELRALKHPGRRRLLARSHADGVALNAAASARETVGGLDFEHRAGDFFQNNPEALPALVARVVADADAPGSDFLVDCYCGAGLFALAAAGRFEAVLGIEVDESNAAAAARNAARNGVGNAEFAAGRAEDLFKTANFDAERTTVVVDPPRRGLSADFVSQLVAYGPRRVVYVSCDPATLARDAAALVASGKFALGTATPFDLFPMTRHIETVLTLDRAPD